MQGNFFNFGYIWFIDVFIFNIMNFEDFFGQKPYSFFVKRTWVHNIYIYIYMM